MRIEATTVQEYLQLVPEDKNEAVKKLYQTVSKNIPKGFEEALGYGMMGFEVPHSIYPAGYHCDPKLALPFVGIAAQKNFIALFHMGIYADENLLNWFVSEFPKHSKRKLDMGKSCVRFKNPNEIPFELIGELMQKMSVKQWIDLYELKLKR
jgi:hypothetical protein